MAKVKAYVYVVVGGTSTLLRPGDEVPSGVTITNPDVIDGEPVVAPAEEDESDKDEAPEDEAPASEPETPETPAEDEPETPVVPEPEPAPAPRKRTSRKAADS